MKKKSEPNKKNKTSPSAKAATQMLKKEADKQKQAPSEYSSYAHGEPIPSVDSVALVAAALLGKRPTTASEAVSQAIELMEIAAWAIYEIKDDHRHNCSGAIAEEEARREKQFMETVFGFSEGAKLITGQKRKDRAVEMLRGIFLERIKKALPNSAYQSLQKRVKAEISSHQKNGFTGAEVWELKDQLKLLKKPKKSA
jgi:hypothetical protein